MGPFAELSGVQLPDWNIRLSRRSVTLRRWRKTPPGGSPHTCAECQGLPYVMAAAAREVQRCSIAVIRAILPNTGLTHMI